MNLGDFRPAGTLKEFYGVLDNLKIKSDSFLCWQTNIIGKRKTFHGKLRSYLANKITTTIDLEVSVEDFKGADKSLTIYLYEQDKGLLLKANYDSYVNGNLKLIADEKVLLREKRQQQRVLFQYTPVYVDIMYGDKISFNKIKLRDIHDEGFGIICTESMTKGLIPGIEVNITKINNIEMPIEIKGQIVHKTETEKVRGQKKGNFLVGVKLNQKSKLLQKVIESYKFEA